MTRATNPKPTAVIPTLESGDTVTVEVEYSNNRGTMTHRDVTIRTVGMALGTSAPVLTYHEPRNYSNCPDTHRHSVRKDGNRGRSTTLTPRPGPLQSVATLRVNLA